MQKNKSKAAPSEKKYNSKDIRINIRISFADLDRIKQMAEKEGLPYQTLIRSVLHKYATGQLS